MRSFNVIIGDVNKREFIPYDVIPYLIRCYDTMKSRKPRTYEEFKEFIKKESMYQWWSRCEYEVVLQDWPCGRYQKKIDVHQQVMMNIDIITDILIREIKQRKKEKKK